MHNVERQVKAIQSRQQRQWLWECASVGLFFGGIQGCVLSLIRMQSHGSFSWLWILAGVALPTIAGVAFAVVHGRSLNLAARSIDQACGLKDRIQTALQFLSISTADSLHRLQIEDADSHLRSLVPEKLAPIVAPKFWNVSILLCAVAILLAFASVPVSSAMASSVVNPVVAAQAARAAESMEAIEQFQKEQSDPALEEMLKEMNQQLESLEQPGVAPKEALAKLSEMENALQEMQKQLSTGSTEKQIKEVGEALSLSEATAAAGDAMSKGDLQKAAAELSSMELPKLDRKTEKAVTEKLEQAERNAAASSKNQDVKKSIEKMRQGLSKGDKAAFEDGARSLAKECEIQAQKKQLSELLKKQAQSLGECKAECEGEARAVAQGPNKGGNKAGKGSGGDQRGEKTAKQNTGKEMKISGQDSGEGDVDTTTSTNPEQEQKAVREYRQKAAKYEAISESALESETIPIGHRQTIRRYFELIRPQGTEADSFDAPPPNATK